MNTLKNIKSCVNHTIFRFALYLFNRWITYIPFHFVRNPVIGMLIGNSGTQCCFLMGLELRNPKNIQLGNNVVVNRNVLLDGRGGKLLIGNNVDIAQETNIWTLEHDVHDDYHKDSGGDVTIEDFVWVGSRSTILPGLTIGRGAVVACGAVVTKNIPSMKIFGGIPAKEIGDRKSDLNYIKFHRPIFE